MISNPAFQRTAIKRAVALAVGVGTVAVAHAVQCEGEDLKEVISLKSLPTRIVDVLHDQGNGFAIADRGEDFQLTDASVGRELPFRRFAVAGLAPHCALISIEHGGRGYSVELYRLRSIGDEWQVVVKGSTAEVPLSLDDLTRSVSITIVPRDAADPSFKQTAAPLLK